MLKRKGKLLSWLQQASDPQLQALEQPEPHFRQTQRREHSFVHVQWRSVGGSVGAYSEAVSSGSFASTEKDYLGRVLQLADGVWTFLYGFPLGILLGFGFNQCQFVHLRIRERSCAHC